MEIFNY